MMVILVHIWGLIVFLKGLAKFMEIGNFDVVLKLKIKVKNW